MAAFMAASSSSASRFAFASGDSTIEVLPYDEPLLRAEVDEHHLRPGGVVAIAARPDDGADVALRDVQLREVDEGRHAVADAPAARREHRLRVALLL